MHTINHTVYAHNQSYRLCTHYPLIVEYIQSIVPEGIQVIAQGPTVAENLVTYLTVHPEIETRCAKDGKIHFLTSENTEVFNRNAQGFLGIEIYSEHVHF